MQRAGIEFFAITDHHSLGSLARAAELVRDTGLRFLPGVELSSQLNGQIYHLLAYGFDLENKALGELAADQLITNDTRHKGEAVGANQQIAKPELPKLVEIVDGWVKQLTQRDAA